MSQQEMTRSQNIGLLIFVVLCGLPALELNGFGFGLPLSLPIALLCAILGGAIGGLLICPRPWIAGIVGGLLAGPIGLLAVYFYTMQREQVWTLELVLVQGLGSLPGVGIGYLLKKVFGGLTAPVGGV